MDMDTAAPVAASSLATASAPGLATAPAPGPNDTAPAPAAAPANSPSNTASPTTRILGWLTLAGLALLLVFAFVISPPDTRQTADGTTIGQFDAVRLLYLHVPSAITAYAAFALTGVGSVVYLWRRSRWWDDVARSSAEIGVVFCGVTLLTGVIWGRPVWNTWWEWGDVRLVTTLVLFLIFVGYLAFRSVPNEPASQARNASVLAIIGALNIVVVNRSVEWWEDRTLHQQSTLEELRIEDETLLSLVLGFVVFGLMFLWLLIHRFRVAWLAAEAEEYELELALRQRREEPGKPEEPGEPGKPGEPQPPTQETQGAGAGP